MSTADTARMTAEEFLALPDDGKERWLIHGQLREKDDGAMTYRNRFPTWVEAKIAFLLNLWLQDQPQPHGAVHSGEVGCRLTDDTLVGIDAAFFSAETIARQSDQTTLVEGAPVLAVEVLSPSDKHEEITEKVGVYLQCGVRAVWIVDPYFKTVQVHRPGAAPNTFNVEQALAGNDALPGLVIPVVGLFPPGAVNRLRKPLPVAKLCPLLPSPVVGIFVAVFVDKDSDKGRQGCCYLKLLIVIAPVIGIVIERAG